MRMRGRGKLFVLVALLAAPPPPCFTFFSTLSATSFLPPFSCDSATSPTAWIALARAAGAATDAVGTAPQAPLDDDAGKNEASPYPGPEAGITWDDYVRSVEIFNLGQKQHTSRPEQAKRFYLEAVAINPYLAEAYLNLGIVSDTHEEVQEAYLNAARAADNGRNNPVYTDAMANLGHFLVEDSGRGHDYHVVEQAIEYYTRALGVTPAHQTTLYNLGIAYEVQGKRQEAYDTYRKVLASNPLHVGANLNAGNLLMYAGLYNLSLAFHERALRGYAELGGHDPWWQVGLLNNMGQTMIAQNDAVTALAYYRKALALVEDEPMTVFNMFKARRSMCDWEGWSDAQVPRMIEMTMNDLYGNAAASSQNKRVQKLGKRRRKRVVRTQDGDGDRSGGGESESNAKTTTMMPYDATLLPVSRRVILDVAIANVQSLHGLSPVQRPAAEVAKDAMLGPPTSARSHAAAVAAPQQSNHGKRGERGPATAGAPLKIAYYGYDFNNHPMGHLTCGMFERHSRERVSVLCTPYGADDDSPQRSRIIQACDIFENTTMLSDFGVASRIANLGAHIAVDLMAHTTGTRIGIPAYHPGEILVNYLGYPGTIGAFADYIMVDRFCVPPETARHDVSEKVAYLPHHYQANDFLPTVDLFAYEDRRSMHADISASVGTSEDAMSAHRDPVVRTRNADTARDLAGLPPRARGNRTRGVALCNFNTIVKVEPVMFKTWLDILQRSPPSTVLWLLRPKGPVGDTVVRNLLREALARGVLKSRLVMAPRVNKFAHLDRLRHCDLFLDTFDYTAHSTASDVLFAGVPVLTVQGQTFASRVAATLVKNAGIDEELLVHSKRDFTDQAVWLTRHPRVLLHLRRRLAHHIFWYPLFDNARLTRNVERSYQAMWEVRHVTGSLTVVGQEDVKRVTHWRPLHLIVAPRMAVIGESNTDVSKQVDAWVEQAVALQTAGTPDDLLRASNIYRRVLAGAPNHADSWHLLGLTRNAQGYSHFGAYCLKQAVRLMPNVAMYRSNLIELQRAAGDTLAAIDNLNVLIRYHPDYELPLDTVRALIDELRRRDEGARALKLFMSHQDVMFESVQRNVMSAAAGANLDAITEVLVSAAVCAFELGDDLARRIAAAAAAAQEQDKPIVEIGEQVVRNPRVLFDVAEQILIKGSTIATSNARILMKLAVMIDHTNRFDESLAVYARAFDALYAERYAPGVRAALGVDLARARARQRVTPPFRGVVVIYCDEYGQTWWPNWGPTSMDQGGAGGSEEAVIFISAELVKLGYHVEIYGEPPEAQWGVYAPTGVWWLPLHSYDETSAPDVFVSWRYHISMFVGDPRPSSITDTAQTRTKTQRYLWLQDISSRFRDQYTPSFVSALHGIFVLSEFHASQGLPEYSKSITHITPNALDEKYFVDGRNENHRFIYASAPNRGLREVLLAWPSIREKIERATPGVEPRLEVYYGFSPSFLKYGKSQMGEAFGPWLAEMKEMLRQDGVEYYGMVDHRTLAKAYARSGFYLYPTSFPETGCVALMKAQALGAIPITSRNPNSTLPELTHRWDLGPPARTDGVTIDRDPAWREAWADAVVRAALSGKEANAHRAGMVREARQRFLWSTVAKQWAAVFEEGLKNPGAPAPPTLREVFGIATAQN